MINYIINDPKMLGDNELSYIVGTCLSTDEKPVIGIYYDSMLFETNTQTWYVFDNTRTWKKNSGGGGGGTTVVANPTLVGTEDDLTGLQVEDTKYKIPSGGVFVANSAHDPGTAREILDKTWKEIKDAGFTVIVDDTSDSEGVYIKYEYVTGVFTRINESTGTLVYVIDSSDSTYLTDSENGYPFTSGIK